MFLNSPLGHLLPSTWTFRASLTRRVMKREAEDPGSRSGPTPSRLQGLGKVSVSLLKSGGIHPLCGTALGFTGEHRREGAAHGGGMPGLHSSDLLRVLEPPIGLKC